ncbi:MAG: alkaline phosphatase D family protein, partial [Burkholderiales bacterium]|nr:alkaline phosphatase D family protein [Burkholderiales bacterium]
QALAAAAPADSIAIAVAGGQYPKGLVDAVPARAGLERLEKRLDGPGAPDLVLFVGDQIVADASAGLVDPRRRDERYDRPHVDLLRLEPLRRVLVRCRSLMMLDDHELVARWEPGPTWPQQPPSPFAREMRRWLRTGLPAYWKYQRLRPLQRPVDPQRPPWADTALVHHGHPVYCVDTRSARSARGSTVAAAQQQILQDGQWRDLEAWLLAQGERPKFVVSASPLLPLRNDRVDRAAIGAHCDGWEAYPHSQARLLEFIARNGLHRTVFLSAGDQLAVACRARLQAPGAARPVELVALQAPALYAPYSFADGSAADWADLPFTTAGGVAVSTETRIGHSGDGFMALRLERAAGTWWLDLEFPDGCGGTQHERIELGPGLGRVESS